MRSIFRLGLVFAALFFCSVEILHAADGKLAIAKKFLTENQLHAGEVSRPVHFDDLHRSIEAIEDPESKFGYTVFSIARHSKKLLNEAQANQFGELIESRKNTKVNWHDIRNIIRVQASISMWLYAALPEEKSIELAQHRSDWEAWTDLRLNYMFQEFVEKEKFQRLAWDILTVDQKKKLQSGEWDQYLKKNTGHSRQFFAEKIVRRECGMPDHQSEFDLAVERRSASWKPMLERYENASRFERKREFSMNVADEKFAHYVWREYAAAFRAFVTAECESVREILQAGYDTDPELSKQIDQHVKDLRQQMVKKFEPGGGDLLRRLGEIQSGL